MSYILDALKKSEQARLNVDTPLSQLLLRGDEPSRAPRRVWPYVTGGVVLLNLAALYAWWQFAPGRSAEPSVQPSPVAMPTPAAPAGVEPYTPPLALPDRGAAPAGLTTPAPAQAPTTLEKPAPSLPAVSPSAIAAVPAAAPAAIVEKTPRAASATPAASATLGAAPVATAPPAATVAVREGGAESAGSDLPEAIRKELPPLIVSGVMRDGSAGALVVVNERPLREGEELVPGLRVEKILERGAQFSYKGYRFQR